MRNRRVPKVTRRIFTDDDDTLNDIDMEVKMRRGTTLDG